jgi:hypothetical protein
MVDQLPAIGRIVLWHSTKSGWLVVPAIVTHVNASGDCPAHGVNLVAFVENGAMPVQSEHLGDEPGCWDWPKIPMPRD